MKWSIAARNLVERDRRQPQSSAVLSRPQHRWAPTRGCAFQKVFATLKSKIVVFLSLKSQDGGIPPLVSERSNMVS